METKNFLGLDGLNHFWEKAKIWIINEITTKIAGIVLSSVPTGTVLQGLYTTVPNGFLLCNGTAYLKTTYPKLFNVISTIYNLPTDSSDIFRVPDLRNRTVMGANPNIAGKAAGATSNMSQVQLAQVPSFSAFLNSGESNYTRAFQGVSASGAAAVTLTANTKAFEYYGNTTCPSQIIINPSYGGGSIDHLGNNVYVNYGEVHPANIRMNYIIKY